MWQQNDHYSMLLPISSSTARTHLPGCGGLRAIAALLAAAFRQGAIRPLVRLAFGRGLVVRPRPRNDRDAAEISSTTVVSALHCNAARAPADSSFCRFTRRVPALMATCVILSESSATTIQCNDVHCACHKTQTQLMMQRGHLIASRNWSIAAGPPMAGRLVPLSGPASHAAKGPLPRRRCGSSSPSVSAGMGKQSGEAQADSAEGGGTFLKDDKWATACPHLHAASAGQGIEANGTDALSQPIERRLHVLLQATCSGYPMCCACCASTQQHSSGHDMPSAQGRHGYRAASCPRNQNIVVMSTPGLLTSLLEHCMGAQTSIRTREGAVPLEVRVPAVGRALLRVARGHLPKDVLFALPVSGKSCIMPDETGAG